MTEHIISALPSYYLAKAPDGGLFVMRDGSHDERTGTQRCLAHIPCTVLGVLVKAREPQALIVEEMCPHA